MTVNPVVHYYTKTLNHRKIVRKKQKYNLLKIKRILKYKLRGGPFFTFSLPVVGQYNRLSQLKCNKIQADGVA